MRVIRLMDVLKPLSTLLTAGGTELKMAPIEMK